MTISNPKHHLLFAVLLASACATDSDADTAAESTGNAESAESAGSGESGESGSADTTGGEASAVYAEFGVFVTGLVGTVDEVLEGCRIV